MNRAFAGRPRDLHLAMHICRGNNQSHWSAEGGYDLVADTLFNKIDVDSYFLEYDTPRAGTFEPLRLVPKNKTVVLGLVSSKFPELESKDSLKRRIDEAARFIATRSAIDKPAMRICEHRTRQSHLASGPARQAGAGG